MQRIITAALVGNELAFSTSRSSGPGGQNVNKVSTKVTLRFDIDASRILTAEEKDILSRKLAKDLTREGVLLLTAQDSRSQIQNRKAVILKLERLLTKAFEKRKARKRTKPSKGSVQQRITGKKRHAEKKKWRQNPI
jgi:ribosome-associated protein